MTRVVHIIFHGCLPNAAVTLGKVELFGTIAHSDSPTKAKRKLQEQLAVQKVDQVVKLLSKSALPKEDGEHNDVNNSSGNLIAAMEENNSNPDALTACT